MVREQIESRGVDDPRVLEAMRSVPRHEFVPEGQRARSYDDRPLPIGRGQTISQPYVVALMSERLAVRAGEKVLEIGSGSGYQAAVLGALGARVFTIEIDAALAEEASRRLERLGYDRVRVRAGDGYYGWPEEAPFDAVIITAATPEIPPAIVEQLRDGGRIVAPTGGRDVQELVVLRKRGSVLERQSLGAVRFVPMTGAVREDGRSDRDAR